VLVAIIQIFNIPISQYPNIPISALLASGFFFLQFIISKGKWIGGGDIRLGFLMGLMLGWPNILLGLFLAYILGTVISLPLVVLGRQNLKSQVPFGVFLSIATIFSLLWGDAIIGWYFRLL
jgi:prepilin signal peptidase PulO-like enzyme (type II secretory pathway)